MAYIFRFLRSGDTFRVADTDSARELFFKAIQTATGLDRPMANRLLANPGDVIETSDYLFGALAHDEAAKFPTTWEDV